MGATQLVTAVCLVLLLLNHPTSAVPGTGILKRFRFANYDCPSFTTTDYERNCRNLTLNELQQEAAEAAQASTAGASGRRLHLDHSKFHRNLLQTYTEPCTTPSNCGPPCTDVLRTIPTASPTCTSELMPYSSFPCNGCSRVTTTFGYYNSFVSNTWQGIPSACGTGPYKKIVLKLDFKAVSGTQYDRLYGMWIGNAAVLIGTTPEPGSTGVTWTVTRDITHLQSVLKPNAEIFFELDNVVSSSLPVPYWARATLLVWTYPSSTTPSAAHIPDAAIPVGNVVSPPPLGGRWVMLAPPQNYASPPNTPPTHTQQIQASGPGGSFLVPAYRAVLELYAHNHDCEEFYTQRALRYTCTSPGNSFRYTMTNPYRELRVYVGGDLAGVHLLPNTWYSGGYDPRLWYSIMGSTSQNFKPFLFDLTPWVGAINAGVTITIEVGNIQAPLWYVSGSLLLWQNSGSTSVTSTPAAITNMPDTAVAALNDTAICRGTTCTIDTPRRLTASSTVTVTSASGAIVQLLSTVDYMQPLFPDRKVYTANAAGGSSWSQTQYFVNTFSLQDKVDSTKRLHSIVQRFLWDNRGSIGTFLDVLLSFNETTSSSMSRLNSSSVQSLGDVTQRHWQGASAGMCLLRSNGRNTVKLQHRGQAWQDLNGCETKDYSSRYCTSDRTVTATTGSTCSRP